MVCTIPAIEGSNRIEISEYQPISDWMHSCADVLSVKSFLIPFGKKDVYIIIILLAVWLIKFLNPLKYEKWSPGNIKKTGKALSKKYPSSESLWTFINKIFTHLQEYDSLSGILETPIPNIQGALEQDFFGIILQNSIPLDERKRLAVNYTTFDASTYLVSLIRQKDNWKIIDPFCGTGRLISAYLDILIPTKCFPRITINDIDPISVLIATCRLVIRLSSHGVGFEHLIATIGDAFDPSNAFSLGAYDLVLMNPPFTRTHRIDNELRNKLIDIETRYKKYLQGQMGLHIYSFLLADCLLANMGTLAAILPASTIYSDYSQNIRRLILKKYSLEIIGVAKNNKSFSEGSNIREIFLLGTKTNIKSCISFLKFHDSSSTSIWGISSLLRVEYEHLKSEWNWLVYLTNPSLFKIRQRLLSNETIKSGRDLKLKIIRGVEMYGPNFFFLPNKIWRIKRDLVTNVVIQSKFSELEVPKSSLVSSLRKPSKYIDKISLDKIEDYAISLSPKNVNDPWVRQYVQETAEFGIIAKKKFGENWISHIYSQILVKEPLGHVFLIDKLSVSTNGVLGHFTEAKTVCSKNFYLIKNLTSNEAKIIVAWLNSSWFLLLYLAIRREIAGSYGRLQINDYMKERLFIDPFKGNLQLKKQIIAEFDKLASNKQESIKVELNKKSKYDLDAAIARFLGISDSNIKNMLNSLYSALNAYLEELIKRDNS